MWDSRSVEEMLVSGVYFRFLLSLSLSLSLSLFKLSLFQTSRCFYLSLVHVSSKGDRALKDSATHVNKFEQGQTDEFDIHSADLGRLSKIR